MIVKDEVNNLERLFASIYKYVDYFIISDTGSTDKTVALIYELGKLYSIPGKVVNHPWIDFGHNRQKALESATRAKLNGEHNCNWLLIIDADEELTVLDKSWKSNLQAGFSYTTFKKLGDFTFKNLFLVWIDQQNWYWHGRVHEFLKNTHKNHNLIHTNSVFILSHQSEGSFSVTFKNSQEKSLFYVEQLKNELSQEKMDSSNANRFFQLVCTYGDLKDYKAAIELLAKILLCQSISPDLKYVTLFYFAKFTILLKQELSKVPEILRTAIDLFPLRREAYYYLAVYYRSINDLKKAKSILEDGNILPNSIPESIIVEEFLYQWKMSYDLVFIKFGLKEFKGTLKLIDHLDENMFIPDIEMTFLQSLKMRINKSHFEKD